jgi:hypothetical protein
MSMRQQFVQKSTERIRSKPLLISLIIALMGGAVYLVVNIKGSAESKEEEIQATTPVKSIAGDFSHPLISKTSKAPEAATQTWGQPPVVTERANRVAIPAPSNLPENAKSIESLIETHSIELSRETAVSPFGVTTDPKL